MKMKKASIISEWKDKFGQKLESLIEEEDNVIQLIKSYTSSIKKRSSQLINETNTSKFLSQIQGYDDKLNKKLSIFLQIKTLILVDDDDFSDEERQDEFCPSDLTKCHETKILQLNSSKIECHEKMSDILFCGEKIDDGDDLNENLKNVKRLSNTLRTIEFLKFEENVPYVGVYIVQVESPSLFWVQIQSDEFELMDYNLQKYYRNLKNDVIIHPKKDAYYCVQSITDNSWYRCVVTKVYEDHEWKVDVLCIDNGQSVFLIHSSELRLLDDLYYKLPRQAMACKLQQIKPKDNAFDWGQNEIDYFNYLTMSRECSLIVKSSDLSENIHGVEIISVENKWSVTQQMLDAGMADLILGSNVLEKKKESEQYKCIAYPVRCEQDSNFLLISHVESDRIYFQVADDTILQIDEINSKMSDWCDNGGGSHINVESLEVSVGSCWIVQDNGRCYRGRVLNKQAPNFFLMHLVDYGDKITVSTDCLKPLKEEHTLLAAFAHQCFLQGITSKNDEPCQQTILDVILMNFLLLGEISSRSYDEITENLYAMTLWFEKDSSEESKVCLNKFIYDARNMNIIDLQSLQEALYVLYGSESLKDDRKLLSECERKSSKEEDELQFEMKNWNPMLEEYESELNTYGYDKDDAGVALTGYKAIDEKICRQYNGKGCCRVNCPFKHIYYDDVRALRTEENFSTFCHSTYFDLPSAGSFIVVQISSSMSPCSNYVCLPSGPFKMKRNENNTSDNISTAESFKLFCKAMTEHYVQARFDGNSGLLPSLGSIVAVKSSEDSCWYRGRVLEVDSQNLQICAFMVDFGNKQCVHFRNTREIEAKFLHMEHQAIECRLPNIAPIGDLWTPKAKMDFEGMTQGKILIAHIIQNFQNNSIYADLYDTSSEENLNIGLEMVRLKHAIQINDVSSVNKPRPAKNNGYLYLPG